jgi:hypothetical protein
LTYFEIGKAGHFSIIPISKSGEPPRRHCGQVRHAHREHDPEKWEPVFRKDHAQTKK